MSGRDGAGLLGAGSGSRRVRAFQCWPGYCENEVTLSYASRRKAAPGWAGEKACSVQRICRAPVARSRSGGLGRGLAGCLSGTAGVCLAGSDHPGLR